MEYKLDVSNDKYIKVTTSGVINRSMLISAISELIAHANYIQKHFLWDFSDSYIGLTSTIHPNSGQHGLVSVSPIVSQISSNDYLVGVVMGPASLFDSQPTTDVSFWYLY